MLAVLRNAETNIVRYADVQVSRAARENVDEELVIAAHCCMVSPRSGRGEADSSALLRNDNDGGIVGSTTKRRGPHGPGASTHPLECQAQRHLHLPGTSDRVRHDPKSRRATVKAVLNRPVAVGIALAWQHWRARRRERIVERVLRHLIARDVE